jgi:uncharacterized protein YndB with AHSA1/START domain
MRSINVSLTLAAPPEIVFSALTNSGAVTKWFAEYAEISLETLRYDFWGRYTPNVPDRDAGQHTINNVTTNQMLSYVWQLGTQNTVVSLELIPEAGLTNLTLNHEQLPERLGFQLESFWSLSLENLRGFVEHHREGLRCDFSQNVGDVLQLSTEIHAAPSTVFDALTNPSQLARYTSPDAEVNTEKGIYDFHFGDNLGPKKILELEPNHKLTHDWHFPNEAESVVTWMCEELSEGTRLTIVHSGFAKDRGSSHALGWLSMMAQLRNMLETGQQWREPLVVSRA